MPRALLIRVAVMCGVFAAWTSSATAQERGEEFRRPDRPRLSVPMSAWVAAAAMDQVTTYKFLSDYPGLLRERNPLVRGLDNRPAAMAAVGGAIDAATGWAAWKVLGRSHPRIAFAVFAGAAAYRAYLVGSNIQRMRGAQDALAAGAVGR
jgi:hypothetical protein